MATRQHKVQTQLGRAAVQIFAANDRMNQVLIEHLDPAAWKAKPPGKARTITAIFTHMHNVRAKRVRLTAPHLKVPIPKAPVPGSRTALRVWTPQAYAPSRQPEALTPWRIRALSFSLSLIEAEKANRR